MPEIAAPLAGPPTGGGFFPLSEVHRGLKGTAWTVFTGGKPEAMEVEILGVLRRARGPGHDLILAQLHGARPEYAGVVAGMSGSPVYIGNRLLGALSFRIGQFSKDPIAGITPIEQMLEVRNLPIATDNLPIAIGSLQKTENMEQHSQAPAENMEQHSQAPNIVTLQAPMQARRQHAADRIYVSLLAPETQAGMEGQTLVSLPLSVANTLEPLRTSQDASLNGESAELEADAPAGGVLSGFQLLNLRVEPGGGLN